MIYSLQDNCDENEVLFKRWIIKIQPQSKVRWSPFKPQPNVKLKPSKTCSTLFETFNTLARFGHLLCPMALKRSKNLPKRCWNVFLGHYLWFQMVVKQLDYWDFCICFSGGSHSYMHMFCHQRNPIRPGNVRYITFIFDKVWRPKLDTINAPVMNTFLICLSSMDKIHRAVSVKSTVKSLI